MESARSNDEPVDANLQLDEERAEESYIHYGEDQDESDDDSSIGVPLISVAPDEALPAMIEKVERPPDGLDWNDNAITDCWNVAIQTHDNPERSEWRAPSLISQHDTEMLSQWKPKSLPIPLWALDPFSHPRESS